MPDDETRADAEAPPGPASEAGGGHEDGCGCIDCLRDYAIEPDKIVADLDPECCPCGCGYTVLRGFLAEGGPETWHLYLSLGMSDYLKLRDKDIAAQHKTGAGSLIWVCSNVCVKHVRVRTAEELQDELLQGAIARRRTGGGEPTPEPGSGPAPETFFCTWDCPQSAKWTRCH
jgi:hypothetical protein